MAEKLILPEIDGITIPQYIRELAQTQQPRVMPNEFRIGDLVNVSKIG